MHVLFHFLSIFLLLHLSTFFLPSLHPLCRLLRVSTSFFFFFTYVQVCFFLSPSSFLSLLLHLPVLPSPPHLYLCLFWPFAPPPPDLLLHFCRITISSRFQTAFSSLLRCSTSLSAPSLHHLFCHSSTCLSGVTPLRFILPCSPLNFLLASSHLHIPVYSSSLLNLCSLKTKGSGVFFLLLSLSFFSHDILSY